jgi:hypothetical protein
MNFKGIVLLLAAISVFSAVATNLALSKTDFVSAEEVHVGSKLLVRGTLSPEGMSKFKVLNANQVGKELDLELAGLKIHRTLRVPITGNQLEIGPFSEIEARKIVAEINNH